MRGAGFSHFFSELRPAEAARLLSNIGGDPGTILTEGPIGLLHARHITSMANRFRSVAAPRRRGSAGGGTHRRRDAVSDSLRC
jgi:hypothetical protein